MEPCDLLSRERINLPDWIRETPSFTKEITDLFLQSRVVFYPGAGDDGHPIKLFGSSRAAFCFVYAVGTRQATAPFCKKKSRGPC
jgi:hypothetical protein